MKKSKMVNKPRPKGAKPPRITHPWKKWVQTKKDPLNGKPLRVMEVTEVDGDWQE